MEPIWHSSLQLEVLMLMAYCAGENNSTKPTEDGETKMNGDTNGIVKTGASNGETEDVEMKEAGTEAEQAGSMERPQSSILKING